MRPTRTSIAIAAALVAVVVVSSAQGAPTTGPWLAGYGSWSTYSMQDVSHNQIPPFADLERLYAAIKSGRDDIKSGPGLGLEFGVDLPRALTFGFGYERLFATDTKSSGRIGVDTVYSSTELKFPANGFYGLMEYRFHTSGPAVARLGLAAGLVSLAPVPRISLINDDTGPDGITLMLRGTGPLLRAYATGEYRLGTEFVVFASAGYRFAKVNKPRVHDVVVSDFPLDYSGVATRLGIKFLLAK